MTFEDLFEYDGSELCATYKMDVLGNGCKPKQFIDYIHCRFDFPGIYLLFHENVLQYVGCSTISIGSRMRDHARSGFFKIDAVLWIDKIRPDLIANAEKELIKLLQPKYNVIGKNEDQRYKNKYRGKKVTRKEQTLDF